eukprot:CAMPEP_0117805852 /NCGR_PEP_ID=MMETSP0948-20121206/18150_1 /TAXON_ID=44440 /ORGANISM="Chattonella subsalsa, Strain CCMP2191" /LENGTH=151 /DNA_ID=CAMNT_0005640077 /DNA_START=108 /DNA_END=559 /DNA_ORIENTATION=-
MLQQVMGPPMRNPLCCIMEIDPFTAIIILLLLSIIGLLATMFYVAKRTADILNGRVDTLSAQLDTTSNNHKQVLEKLADIVTLKPLPSAPAVLDMPQQQPSAYDISIAKDIATSAIMDYNNRQQVRKPRGRGRGRSNHAHRTGEFVIPMKS